MKKYENYAAALDSLSRATALRYYTFMDEDLWLRMLRDRNDSAHIYDGARMRRLVDTIIDDYIPEFERLRQGLRERYGTMLER